MLRIILDAVLATGVLSDLDFSITRTMHAVNQDRRTGMADFRHTTVHAQKTSSSKSSASSIQIRSEIMTRSVLLLTTPTPPNCCCCCCLTSPKCKCKMQNAMQYEMRKIRAGGYACVRVKWEMRGGMGMAWGA